MLALRMLIYASVNSASSGCASLKLAFVIQLLKKTGVLLAGTPNMLFVEKLLRVELHTLQLIPIATSKVGNCNGHAVVLCRCC